MRGSERVISVGLRQPSDRFHVRISASSSCWTNLAAHAAAFADSPQALKAIAFERLVDTLLWNSGLRSSTGPSAIGLSRNAAIYMGSETVVLKSGLI
jgi:hypothetical protein